MKIKDTKLNNALNVVARWFVGLVFLFSSFTKGVDPMGTMFKVQDYMSNWTLFGSNFEWAYPLAGVLAVGLICLEFAVGALLLFNSFRKITAWTLAVMMLFFTATTLVDAVTNLVDDCGCFGDFVKLTNWQTFWKNVILDVPTVWILLSCGLQRRSRFERDIVVLISAVVVMLVFAIYNIKHEPVLDFRPWKIGNQMLSRGADETPKSYVTYKNTATGEEMEFESAKLMEYMSDSSWASQWEWLSSRVETPEVLAPGFSMMDMDLEDHAVDMVAADEGLEIITLWDLAGVDERGLAEVKAALTQSQENGTEIVILTSALPEEVQAWLYDNEMGEVPYYFADATAIKTMLRGNPGFVYLKKGVVVDKGRKALELRIEN